MPSQDDIEKVCRVLYKFGQHDPDKMTAMRGEDGKPKPVKGWQLYENIAVAVLQSLGK